MQKFYTTGYSGKDVADLRRLLASIDAVLVDIRFSPTSELMKWRQVYLQTLLREKYHHVMQLGNRAFRENKFMIQNVELGIKILTGLGANAVLFCSCEELKQCHRFVIMEELRRRGFEVGEIENWKAAEAILF